MVADAGAGGSGAAVGGARAGAVMKHDRPVSELLDECARALPEPFTRQDILAWFRRMHPDVPPNTVGARIFGLTEGDAPSRDHFQFGGSRPILERVGRGLYRRAPAGPASRPCSATPTAHPPTPATCSRSAT